MFTGIIEATGVVRGVQDLESTRRFQVEALDLVPELALGDSVAVDGACLTVAELGTGRFGVDVIGTTLERTIAGTYAEGRSVNLERAMKLGDRMDGHLVQGHVDGMGYLQRCVKQGEFWLMDFELPADVAALTVARGSVTINGVSLTVAEELGGRSFRIGVIPFTHAHTNLGSLRDGAPVNVEGDLIGKYVGRVLSARTGDGSTDPTSRTAT